MLLDQRFSRAYRVLASCVIGALAISSTAAFAQVAGGNAYDVKATISLAGLATLNIDPIKQVQAAPQAAAYAVQDQLLDWSDGNAVASASAGALQSALQWAPGNGGQFVAGADASAANVAVDAVSLLGASLISIAADQVHSQTLIAGQCPTTPAAAGPHTDDLGDVIADLLYGNGFDEQNLVPVNDVDLPGLVVSILGTPIPNLPLNPPPNTGIDLQGLGIAGATLMLNERSSSGDGIHSLAESTNALHFNLNAAGLISADVTLGHAETSVNCSP